MATARRQPRARVPRTQAASIQLNREGLRISQEQHDKLVLHLRSLLDMGAGVRNVQIQRYEAIDREVYGYLVLDKDDTKRERDNQKGHGVKPTDVKLPLTLVRLEEAITYILLVLAPDEGIYSAIAPAEHQKVAKAFSRLMNEHAEYFGHYRNFGIFFFNALKYNFGALLTEWQNVYGNLIGNAQDGSIDILREQLVQTGNQILALDPYNTLYDPSVEPLTCYREGEFVAYVEQRRGFWLERAANRGEYFNVDKILEVGGTGQAANLSYYRERPLIDAKAYSGLLDSGGQVNWFSLLSMGVPQGTSYAHQQMHEVKPMWIQLYPDKWGLGPDKTLQIWRITLVNGKQIVEAVPMSNAHGNLPVVFAMPNEDGFRWQAKSWAEYLTPFNRFASQQLNTHQQANRRALYGLTFYDANLFPDLANEDADLVAGKYAFKDAGQDFDIRRRITQVFDAPKTENTMETIDQLDDMMEKVLPTQMAPQVASLERATQYQAAATVQSANRRNLKIAKVIDSQSMAPCRHMQMYNILQYQPSVEVITDEGELLTADPKQFRTAKLQFKISDGLRGLDKLTLILHIKDALNAVVQSQQASQQIDIVKLLDYWTSLIGDNTDFSQFRLQSPMDGLPVEQRNAAYQLLQQALQQQGAPGAAAPAGGAAQTAPPPPRP